MKFTLPALSFLALFALASFESCSYVANDLGLDVPSLTDIFEKEEIASEPPVNWGYFWRKIPNPTGGMDATRFDLFRYTDNSFEVVGSILHLFPYYYIIR